VIDFGGFFSVSQSKIVSTGVRCILDASPTRGDSITLELTKAQSRAAPEYKGGYADRVARRFGQPAAAAICP